jgi:Protein of unknown function (DUF3179)
MVKNTTVFSCVVAGSLIALLAAAQEPATARPLPYAAVHDPQFIGVAEATFMGADDRVIGVMDGATAKTYPAGILSQHGLVEDRTRSGPIAITW